MLPATGGNTMNAGRPTRSTDRIERIARGMAAIALLAALAWAVMSGSTPAEFLPDALWG